jgi:hypothetical protein
LNQALRILRVIAVVGHVLTALITTNIFDNELSHVLHASTPREVLHRGYALTATIAFVLGYFVYYKWHSAPGKWIWIVGVLWFVERAFSAWHEPNSVLTAGPSLGTVSYQMFGLGPNIPVSLTLVRTTLYSSGAWACWYGEKYGWSALKACLNALRGGGSTET